MEKAFPKTGVHSKIKINEKLGDDIVIALDSTGIKVANRGEWIRHK